MLLIYFQYATMGEQYHLGVEMKKLIDFKSVYLSVKEYAEKNCDGNFSLAVRVLIKKGLANDKH